MEILADSSIPEPSRQVPLQQRLIERAASRPMDPVLRQNFDNMQDRGQAQHNAQLTAVRQQQVQASITGPAHQQPVQRSVQRSITNQDRSRNSRGNSVRGRGSGGGRGSRGRRNDATPSHSAPPPYMPTLAETALNNQAAVNAWNNSNRPDGTDAAYAPKEAEYYDFCIAVYGPELCRFHTVNCITALPPAGATVLYTVTPQKCLAFCFYQAHRDKRTSSQAAMFDIADYTRVQNLYQGQEGAPLPPNPMGASHLRGYVGAVRSIYASQKAHNANSWYWVDGIYNGDMKALIKMVRNRKPMVDYANAAEKITSEILPFMYKDYLLDIEKYMWSRAVNTSNRAVLAALRDGYTMKQTTQAVLRGESLEKADLSDCFDLKIKTDEDHHPLHIDVLQVATGKCLLQSYST
jgi:hypothetical protein